MSTQLVGVSMCGIYKRFVIAPPSMIWPQTLLLAVLFSTLHGQETSGTQAYDGISRLRFFYYVFIGYILYSKFFGLGNWLLCCGSSLLLFLDFLPSYVFTALSSFSWVCWIAPNNAKVNQLFGVSHGLAMGILTFDWGQIAFLNSPLGTPWWAAANTGFSIAFFYWFLVPILYVGRITLPFAFFFSFLNIGFCSTPTSGSALTFPWCPHTPSITQGSNTTSLKSSIPIPLSTSRLTRPTAPSSFPHRSPFSTASRLQPSPLPLHILSSTTASIYGLMLVAHSPNDLISTSA
jgi:hypothetical protein